MRSAWKPAALVAGILVVWELVVRVFDVAEFLVPAPSAVAIELVTRWDYFAKQMPATITEIWVGFAIAVVLGIALAIPVALTDFGQQAIMPVLVATQTIPKAALAPLFVIWFGFDLTPKIAIAALIAFFPIVVNMALGLSSVDDELVQYMATLGASKMAIFRKLRLPASVPYLTSAMKMSISLATIGAIVGEFVGADQGLGYTILRAINNFDTAAMFAAIFLVSAIGMASYWVIVVLERSLLRWKPQKATVSVSASI